MSVQAGSFDLNRCEQSVEHALLQHKPEVRNLARLLPVKVLSRVFRGKFVSGLKQAFDRGDLYLPGALQPLKKRAAYCEREE